MVDSMQRNDRREPALLPYIRPLAVLVFALLAVQGADAATKKPAAEPMTSAGAAAPSAKPKEKWEGYWARTRKECRYSDEADSKTMIDLKNVENGRPAPLFDQYENHCRIDSHATKGNVTTLKLICFEFWDDYKSKKSPRRDTVAVTAGPTENSHERQILQSLQEVRAAPASLRPQSNSTDSPIGRLAAGGGAHKVALLSISSSLAYQPSNDRHKIHRDDNSLPEAP